MTKFFVSGWGKEKIIEADTVEEVKEKILNDFKIYREGGSEGRMRNYRRR